MRLLIQPFFRRSFLHLWLGLLFLSSLLVCLWFGQTTAWSQTTSPASQVQQGVERYQRGDYPGAIATWEAALTEYRRSNNRDNQAIVLENLARAYQQIGQTQQAIATWEQLISLARQLQNPQQLGRALTEQAQTYSTIGQSGNAITRLCGDRPTLAQSALSETALTCLPGTAVQIARATQDAALEAAALGSLGNAYRLLGEYEWAIELAFKPSLELAQKLNNVTYQISALNGLGKAYLSLAQLDYRRAEFAAQRGDPEAQVLQRAGEAKDRTALEYFERSQAIAQHPSDRLGGLQALLNAIPAYYRTGNLSAVNRGLQQAEAQLGQLPNSRERVYAAIDLARLLQLDASGKPFNFTVCPANLPAAQIETLLQGAIATARQLQDARAASFALGELGHLYECQRNYATAMKWTQEARWEADQALAAKDSLYLWEWQSGRILKQQNQIPDAIAAYQRAANTLETIRGDILTAARDVQFDFRDTVEPIYRDLVALKLSQAQPLTANKSESASDQRDLDPILNTIDSLKLAELQNYFGNECVIVAPRQGGIDPVADRSTAIFSTFILDDRTAVILKLPNGEEKFVWINQTRSRLLEEVNQFRRELESYQLLVYNPAPARQLYDQLIRPFVADLEQAQVKTLIFVQDGIFRSVPMAALQDGDRFLIQQYAIATTPSLTLTDARVLQREDLRVLALGLTEAKEVEGRVFPALVNVERELAGIQATIPDSLQLLNQDFTRDRLEAELSRTVFPIIHIATHGSFGTDPADTFIVTGDGQELAFNDLELLIRRVTRNPEPLELLALTACETAAGDDRSALGLAGVAVQAGAKSAIASLWTINDAATANIATEFYKNLREPDVSRAEALQAAQLSYLQANTEARRFVHPGLWSALVLVGNWR